MCDVTFAYRVSICDVMVFNPTRLHVRTRDRFYKVAQYVSVACHYENQYVQSLRSDIVQKGKFLGAA